MERRITNRFIQILATNYFVISIEIWNLIHHAVLTRGKIFLSVTNDESSETLEDFALVSSFRKGAGSAWRWLKCWFTFEC